MSAPVFEASLGPAPPRASALRHLLADPLGRFGLALVLAILLTAIFAGAIAPYNPTAIAIPDRLQAPSLAHLFTLSAGIGRSDDTGDGAAGGHELGLGDLRHRAQRDGQRQHRHDPRRRGRGGGEDQGGSEQ